MIDELGERREALRQEGALRATALVAVPSAPATKRTRGQLAISTAGRTPGQIVLPTLPLLGPISPKDAVSRRRALPIHAYIGPNGEFKSATMILDTIPSLLEGRRVLSTVRILDPETGEDHPQFELFEHWDQLKDFSHGDLLLDEVAGAANSRSNGLPDDIQNILNQLRRRDVMLRFTAPAYDRADKIIRETAQGITLCHGYFPDKSIEARTDEEGNLRAWAPNRMAIVNTYDGRDMAAFSVASTTAAAGQKKPKLRAKFQQIYWAPKTGVFDYYNTLDPVSLVSYLCPVCGGKRVAKQCRGHDAA